MFQTPTKLYHPSAEDINSNILRINIRNSFGQPVDMTGLGLSVFIKSPSRDHDENFITQTLTFQNSLKIRQFNRTVPGSALVLLFRVVDPNLSLRAFLRIGQQPTLEKYSLATTFTAANLTNEDSFSWVVSRDMLRNITEFPESQEFFLGVMLNGDLGRVGNKTYSLRVLWVTCLILEEEKTWKSSGCEVSRSHVKGTFNVIFNEIYRGVYSCLSS